METYTDFASVYDTFMDNTPYAEWAGYILSLLEQYGAAASGGIEAEHGRGTEIGTEDESFSVEETYYRLENLFYYV